MTTRGIAHAEYLKEGEMTQEKTGAKRRKTAVRFDLLEPEFLMAMAHIMSVGAEKYGSHNWQKGLSGANGGINHSIKHIMEYQAGLPCDYGPRKVHLAQVAVNAMFEFFYETQRELNSNLETIKKSDALMAKIAEAPSSKAILDMHETGKNPDFQSACPTTCPYCGKPSNGSACRECAATVHEPIPSILDQYKEAMNPKLGIPYHQEIKGALPAKPAFVKMCIEHQLIGCLPCGLKENG